MCTKINAQYTRVIIIIAFLGGEAHLETEKMLGRAWGADYNKLGNVSLCGCQFFSCSCAAEIFTAVILGEHCARTPYNFSRGCAAKNYHK